MMDKAGYKSAMFVSSPYHMKRGHKKMILLFALALSALIIISALYAPNYLKYADAPIKADAVVLFIGPDFETRDAREKEANKLLDTGYADYLITPTYGLIYRKIDQQSLGVNNDSSETKKSAQFGNYPRFYEATHIEVLETKRIMDHLGLKKANFVSSPWHLRRIKMITGHVFHLKNSDPIAYQIKFVPAHHKPSSAKVPPWDLKYWGTIASEYIKITWFYLYNVFSYKYL